jgi:hypothetical protein
LNSLLFIVDNVNNIAYVVKNLFSACVIAASDNGGIMLSHGKRIAVSQA